MVSILCCQSLCVIDSCSVSLFFSFFFCHSCGLNFVLPVTLCHWFLFFFSVLFSSLILSHLCGFNLVLSAVLCHWLLCCESFFFLIIFLSLLVVSILRCQSFSVIDSCFVCPFSSLILCHLCGLNLVLSITLCHWLLFWGSFFLTLSLSLLC